jgi:hypothetical protein
MTFYCNNLKYILSGTKAEQFYLVENFINLLNKDFSFLKEHFNFYIIHSFFTPYCVYKDIDIAIVKKNNFNIFDHVNNMNNFFKTLHNLNLNLYGKLDVQFWDIEDALFHKAYNSKNIIFGQFVFKKYSGKPLDVSLDLVKIDNFLWCRESEPFTYKHYKRFNSNTYYYPPFNILNYTKK